MSIIKGFNCYVYFFSIWLTNAPSLSYVKNLATPLLPPSSSFPKFLCCCSWFVFVLGFCFVIVLHSPLSKPCTYSVFLLFLTSFRTNKQTKSAPGNKFQDVTKSVVLVRKSASFKQRSMFLTLTILGETNKNLFCNISNKPPLFFPINSNYFNINCLEQKVFILLTDNTTAIVFSQWNIIPTPHENTVYETSWFWY